MTKEEIIEQCYEDDNKLELTKGSIVNGKKKIWKWTPYWTLKNDKQNLDACNLRTICKNEIVIEFDSKDGKPTKEQTDAMIQRVSSGLRRAKVNHEVWDYGGSKSKHIHIRGIEFLNQVDEKKRRSSKLTIVKHFLTDEEKKFIDESNFINRTVIALEECPHWKYGSQKTLVRTYTRGSNNHKVKFFNDIVLNSIDSIHSNSSNMSNKSNLDTMTSHTNLQARFGLKPEYFGTIEPEEVRKSDIEWYKSTDFTKGGLTIKENGKYPCTILHNGINVVRFYDKVDEMEIGRWWYSIYKVQAFFMQKLKYEQYGFIAFPRNQEPKLIETKFRYALENKIEGDLKFVTFVIHRQKSGMAYKYDYEIINQVYTVDLVNALMELKKEGNFEQAPLLIPKFYNLTLKRKKGRKYKSNHWINKMEAVIKGEKKMENHQQMVDLCRELRRIGVPHDQIHEVAKANEGKEYCPKITNYQLKSIDGYLSKQRKGKPSHDEVTTDKLSYSEDVEENSEQTR